MTSTCYGAGLRSRQTPSHLATGGVVNLIVWREKLQESGGVLEPSTHAILGFMRLNFLSIARWCPLAPLIRRIRGGRGAALGSADKPRNQSA